MKGQKTRWFFMSPIGRKKCIVVLDFHRLRCVAVLGAINAVGKELLLMTEATYVDSMTVYALLKELAIRY